CEARFAELQELLAHDAPAIERLRARLEEWFQIGREVRGIQTRNRIERESGALTPVLGRRFRHGSLLVPAVRGQVGGTRCGRSLGSMHNGAFAQLGPPAAMQNARSLRGFSPEADA